MFAPDGRGLFFGLFVLGISELTMCIILWSQGIVFSLPQILCYIWVVFYLFGFAFKDKEPEHIISKTSENNSEYYDD